MWILENPQAFFRFIFEICNANLESPPCTTKTAFIDLASITSDFHIRACIPQIIEIVFHIRIYAKNIDLHGFEPLMIILIGDPTKMASN